MARFDLSAGVLCLDFCNTVDWHASSEPKDRLQNYSDLTTWGEEAGVLSNLRAESLKQTAEAREEEAAAAFALAVQLREALYRIFAGIALGENAVLTDLEILNDCLPEAMSHLQVSSTDSGYQWQWIAFTDTLNQVFWPVARSAAELLTSDKLDRVRHCADDRGCGMLFLDTSKNKSRIWCSMESCGNRAKAKRHYQKAKTGG